MARSVTRLGLPSRMNTNPNTVPTEEFVPGPTIPVAALSTPSTAQPMNPNTPQSLYVNSQTRSVQTPYGLIAVHFTATNQNGVVSLKPSGITKNVIFTLPYNNQEGNATISGKATYTYGIVNGNVEPVLLNNNGSVLYQPNSTLFNKAQSEYNEGKQGIVDTEQQLTAYQTALQKPGQSASYYQNYALAIKNLMTGEYSGWNTLNYYQGLEQQGSAQMQEYAPVKIANITSSGITLTGAQPKEYIYGQVNGKNTFLGTLDLVPSMSGNNVSFSPGSFKGAIVQVSGQGWYGGIMTTFANGGVVINPKNYTSITTNAYNISSNGATYSYMNPIPTGFGIHQEFGKMSFGGGLISAKNVIVPTTQGEVIEGFKNGAWFRSGGLSSIITSGKNFNLTQAVTVNPSSGAVSLTAPSGQAGTVGTNTIYENNGQFSFASGQTSESSTVGGITTLISVNPSSGAVSQNVSGSYTGTVGQGARAVMTKLGFSSSSLSSLPSGTKVSIAPNASGTLVANFTSPSQNITYTTDSQTNMPTGEIVRGQNGNFVSGSNFIKPVMIAGGNVSSATFKGDTLTLPMQQYVSYQNANLASAVQSKENANVQSLITNPTVDKFAGLIFPVFTSKGGAKFTAEVATSQYDPFYQAVQAGTLTSLGYNTQGTSEFVSAEVMGANYAIIGASGGIAAVDVTAGELALGTSVSEVVATRALTGASISVGLGEALSYSNTGKLMSPGQTLLSAGLGASTGIILGGSGAPVGATVSETVGYTALQVGKGAAVFGLITGGTSFAVGVADPSVWNGTTSANQGKTQSQKMPNPESQSVVQSMENSLYQIQNHPKSFLSFVGKSTLSGAYFGSEYGGAFAAGGQALGAGVKAISPEFADFASTNPIITKVGLSAFNAGVTTTYGIATRQPLRVIAPEVAVMAAFPLLPGVVGTPDAARTDEASVTPTKTVVGYSVAQDEGGATLGTKYTPTSVDMLNYMHAEPMQYLPDLSSDSGPQISGLRTGTDYQVVYQGGRILYSATSAQGLAGASSEIGSTLFGGDREYFSSTFAARMPVYTTTEGQASTITAVGRTDADINVPKGTKSFYGYPVNKIAGISFEFQGSSAAASTDALTQTAETTYDVTTRLTVRNNIIDRFFSGSSTRDVVISKGTVNVEGADVSPLGDKGFMGRILPKEDGYSIVQGESKSTFYGAGGKEVTVGVPGISKGVTMTEYTGYQLTDEGNVVPTYYYETSDITDAAYAFNVKSAIPPASLQSVQERPWKPLKLFSATPEEGVPSITDNVLPSSGSGEVQSTSAPAVTIKPVVPTAPGSISLSSADFESPLSITGSDPLILGNFGTTGYLPAIKGNGNTQWTYTPLIGDMKNPPATVVPGVPQIIRGKIDTGNITKGMQKLEYGFGNASSNLEKNLFGEKNVQRNKLGVGITDRLNNPYAQTNRTSTPQKTLNTQKTSTLQKQITVTPLNSITAVLPPPPPPNYFGDVNPQFPKLKPSHKFENNRSVSGVSKKGYVSDLMHSELRIFGRKTNIGISRPLVRGRRKK